MGTDEPRSPCYENATLHKLPLRATLAFNEHQKFSLKLIKVNTSSVTQAVKSFPEKMGIFARLGPRSTPRKRVPKSAPAEIVAKDQSLPRIRLRQAPFGNCRPLRRHRASRESPSSPPTSSSLPPRRPGRGQRPRPCHGGWSLHRNRRITLVHRLGARHQDLAGGAHPRHRPVCGGGMDPAHLRAVREKRPEPEPLPGGEERGSLPYRRREPLVLPRPGALPGGDRRPRNAQNHHAADARERAPEAGGSRIPAHLDGAKVGDWVVTPRRGKAVEINALWYNALRLMQRWSAEEGDHPYSDPVARPTAVQAEPELRLFNCRIFHEIL
jgi:hypothetical protein